MFSLLLLAFCAMRTQAMYYMDDRNASVFLGYNTSSNSPWSLENADGAHDGTVSGTMCSTGNNCTMEILFTGIGITLYCVNETKIVTGDTWVTIGSINVTVDGNTDLTETVSLYENKTGFNIPFYNIQSLLSGNHFVTVLLLTANPYTQFNFDYAAVNQTTPVPASSNHSNHSKLGITVGAAVGASAVILIAMLVAFICVRRKKPKRTLEKTDLDPEPIFDSSYEDEGNSRPVLPSFGTTATLSHTTISSPFQIDTISTPVSGPGLRQDLTYAGPDTPSSLANVTSDSNPSWSQRLPHVVLAPPPLHSSVAHANSASKNDRFSAADTHPPTTLPASNLPAAHASSGAAPAQLTQREWLAAANMQDTLTTQLTDGEIDSVARLLRSGVPATEVARVMESLRADGAARAQGSRNSDDGLSTAPPCYDAIDG